MKFKLWDDDNKNFSYISFDDLEELVQTLDSWRDYFGKNYFKNNPEFLTIYNEETDEI